jgi:hypothetical protein
MSGRMMGRTSQALASSRMASTSTTCHQRREGELLELVLAGSVSSLGLGQTHSILRRIIMIAHKSKEEAFHKDWHVLHKSYPSMHLLYHIILWREWGHNCHGQRASRRTPCHWHHPAPALAGRVVAGQAGEPARMGSTPVCSIRRTAVMSI